MSKQDDERARVRDGLRAERDGYPAGTRFRAVETPSSCNCAAPHWDGSACPYTLGS